MDWFQKTVYTKLTISTNCNFFSGRIVFFLGELTFLWYFLHTFFLFFLKEPIQWLFIFQFSQKREPTCSSADLHNLPLS